jgi:hypothetical protein
MHGLNHQQRFTLLGANTISRKALFEKQGLLCHADKTRLSCLRSFCDLRAEALAMVNAVCVIFTRLHLQICFHYINLNIVSGLIESDYLHN